jgi:ABC-type branched-subunit amino acid transport system permease subunit
MGAIITVVLLQIANSYFGSVGGGGLAWIIYGAVIILFVLFQPGGLISLVNKILKFIKKKLNIRTEIPVK